MATGAEHIVFCDGACSGNPGPGGWGSVIATIDGEVAEIGGHEPGTTNNRMELRAAIEALKALAPVPGPVAMHTDSSYVINGITKWIWGWRQKGWKTAEGADVLNRDLWEELSGWIEKRVRKSGYGGVRWVYVPGHAGVPGNERVDAIAVAFSQRQSIPLFRGERKDYDVDLTQVPAAGAPLPSKKPSKTKGPVQYLSLVHGKAARHKTWSECEARVKGVSGAKYKKFTSPDEEAEILASWGVKSP